MDKTKVFLIPYAGGSSFAYYKWKDLFSSNFELCFIELAGRGQMSNRNFYKSIDEAAEDITQTIINSIKDEDVEYLLFGHSMGALLAYEVYYKLSEKNIRLPKHIFFSGREAPQVENSREKIYEYDDDAFLEKISIYGGLPNEFYDEEIKKFFVPIFKSDFRLLIEYMYSQKSEKIKCNISVLFGEADCTVTMKGIKKWGIHAGEKIDFYKFKGEHFFINDECKEISKIISQVAL